MLQRSPFICSSLSSATHTWNVAAVSRRGTRSLCFCHWRLQKNARDLTDALHWQRTSEEARCTRSRKPSMFSINERSQTMTSIIKKITNIFPVLVILVAVASNAARGQQPPIGGIDPGVLHLPRPDKIATPPFITAGTAIRQKYSDLASQNGVLGEATTDVLQCPDAVGYYVHYQGGSIYWTPDTGAHEIHGTIREKWAAMGWERSLLGYPLTDESTAPDGTGRYNQFQNGSIYWTPDTGAHEIHGGIREKWAAMGWERSLLGYPLTDENTTPAGFGRYNPL